MTFYASIVANVFSKKEFSNHHMTIVLPSLVKALTSDLKDFRAAGYITAGQLVSCNQVEKDLIDKLLELILNVSFAHIKLLQVVPLALKTFRYSYPFLQGGK